LTTSGRLQLSRFPPDKLCNLVGLQRRPIGFLGTETLHQKSPSIADIILPGADRIANYLVEVLVKIRYPFADTN
jgi:hypothetical protein